MLLNKIAETTKFLQTNTTNNLTVGIILGTGLGAFVCKRENPTILIYDKIRNFSVASMSFTKAI